MDDKDTRPDKGAELDELATRLAEPLEEKIKQFREEQTKHFEDRDTALMERVMNEIEEKVLEIVKENEKIERKYTIPGTEPSETTETFFLSRCAQAIAHKDWDRYAPFEKAVLDEYYKQQATTPDSAGGYSIPEVYVSDIIDALRSNVVAMQAGATMMNIDSGLPVRIPKIGADATAAWTAENAPIADSTVTYEAVTMSPTTLAALVKTSNVLVENSAPTADMVIRHSITEQLRRGLDKAVLIGSGTGAEPLGILNQPGLTTVSAGSGPPQYSHLIECLRVLAAKDASRGRVGWICHPDFIHACQLVDNTTNTTSGTGLDVERRMLAEKPVDRLVGYPYYTTTQLGELSGLDSATSVILGAWQDCLIGNWKGIEIRASDVAGTAFETDQLWVRGLARMDTNVRHLDSFLALVDVQQASGT